MTTTAIERPLILTDVTVRRVERLSPSYVRVWLGDDELAEFGVAGSLLDQRIKLIFPGPAGLPDLAEIGENWYADWLALPEERRGCVRTYTVRDVEGTGRDTQLVVDFVLHLDAAGPGCLWAASATVGDRLVVLAPRRDYPFGGIEFLPGEAKSLVLAADETAVPAVAGILRDLPATAEGTAFLEVPEIGDRQELDAPAGVEVVWLPRAGRTLGEPLVTAVLDHLAAPVAVPEVSEDDVDPDLWETPTYSSSGEPVDAGAIHVGHDLDGIYAWIAGEARVVTALRRALVKDLGMDRRQVSFMGYWREGVSMK